MSARDIARWRRHSMTNATLAVVVGVGLLGYAAGVMHTTATGAGR